MGAAPATVSTSSVGMKFPPPPPPSPHHVDRPLCNNQVIPNPSMHSKHVIPQEEHGDEDL
jgi:hypothetical protein